MSWATPRWRICWPTRSRLGSARSSRSPSRPPRPKPRWPPRCAPTVWHTCVVDADALPQTCDVVRTRAAALGLKVVLRPTGQALPDGDIFGVLVQYPGASGVIPDLAAMVQAGHERNALVVAA